MQPLDALRTAAEAQGLTLRLDCQSERHCSKTGMKKAPRRTLDSRMEMVR